MHIGKNTVIGNAKIQGMTTQSPHIVIGDNCYIGDDVQIIADEFILGDYCKIQHHTNIHGHSIKIGHNAWIGQYTIIDGLGNTIIGNNCGIGAHSQLWSHMKYGDQLEGCRFNSEKPLIIGNDVWLVGHCIVSPVNIADKAMALVGSVITTDLKYNKTYAGTPAKDITDKFGPQFLLVDIETKYNLMVTYVNQFYNTNKNHLIKIVKSKEDINWLDNISYFNVEDRSYTKKFSKDEIDFIKYLLPSKAKFIPYDTL